MWPTHEESWARLWTIMMLGGLAAYATAFAALILVRRGRC
ncbi:hypothetical protein J2Y41_001335 [Arthrobacter sp. 1088]|nr:hypothetical protein [Arthrobacter sp. 1088]